jgi:hypothetical protein
MAAHSAGTIGWWAQHDIWILYGNSSVGSNPFKISGQPVFNLTSTNTSWDYDTFKIGSGNRTAEWIPDFDTGNQEMPRHYGGNQGADASTFSELGIEVDTGQAIQYSGLWLANNVCGITNANFQNGEQFATELIGSLATIVYQGPLGTMVPISTIAQPSVINSWEAWSANQAFTADPDYPRWIGFRLEALQATAEQGERFVEANDVTLTLDSTQTPTLTIGAEQDNYSLDCVIANDTTGLSIRVTHFMALNEELEVNTDAKTVTDKSDNSSQFQARKLVEGARLQWLPLAVGENTLSFTDAGTNGVTITIDWEQRYYS